MGPDSTANDRPAGAAQASSSPGRSIQRIWRPLLIAGAAIQLIALYLPWERTEYGTVPGHRAFVDYPVATVLVPNPGLIYAPLIFGPSPSKSLAAVFVSSLLLIARPLIGIVLLLAFFTWPRPVIRWPLAFAYGLWLAFLTLMAAQFVITLAGLSAGTHASLCTRRDWWCPLISVSEFFGGTAPLPQPAWGFWVLMSGLALSWVGWVWMLVRLWRGKRSGAGQHAGAEAAAPRAVWAHRLGAAALILGAIVWASNLLALPMGSADCAHPLQSAAPRELQTCEQQHVIYALQVVALAVAIAPIAMPSNDPTRNPARVELSYLEYLRDFTPLALALVAAPFALATSLKDGFRAGRSWWPALWAALWAALVCAVTLFIIEDAAALLALSRDPRLHPTFAWSIGPAFVLLPLGALLIGAGIIARWRSGAPSSTAASSG